MKKVFFIALFVLGISMQASVETVKIQADYYVDCVEVSMNMMEFADDQGLNVVQISCVGNVAYANCMGYVNASYTECMIQ